jgi:hypothetical protein
MRIQDASTDTRLRVRTWRCLATQDVPALRQGACWAQAT